MASTADACHRAVKTGRAKVRYFIWYSLQRDFSSSMTHHFATFNEILLTKSGFSRAKCTKIVLIFGRTPLGQLRCSPDLLVNWGGGAPFPSSFRLNAFVVLVAGAVFKSDHLANLYEYHCDFYTARQEKETNFLLCASF